MTSIPTSQSQPGGSLGGLISFPDPVNEVSARLVAGGVVIMSALMSSPPGYPWRQPWWP